MAKMTQKQRHAQSGHQSVIRMAHGACRTQQGQAFRQLAKSFWVLTQQPLLLLTRLRRKPADADPDNSILKTSDQSLQISEARLKAIDERESAAMQNAANQTWANWSKDKTHAGKVRGLMANLINSDLALIRARTAADQQHHQSAINGDRHGCSLQSGNLCSSRYANCSYKRTKQSVTRNPERQPRRPGKRAQA